MRLLRRCGILQDRISSLGYYTGQADFKKEKLLRIPTKKIYIMEYYPFCKALFGKF